MSGNAHPYRDELLEDFRQKLVVTGHAKRTVEAYLKDAGNYLSLYPDLTHQQEYIARLLEREHVRSMY